MPHVQKRIYMKNKNKFSNMVFSTCGFTSYKQETVSSIFNLPGRIFLMAEYDIIQY
jgi:hypothetical protein